MYSLTGRLVTTRDAALAALATLIILISALAWHLAPTTPEPTTLIRPVTTAGEAQAYAARYAVAPQPRPSFRGADPDGWREAFTVSAPARHGLGPLTRSTRMDLCLVFTHGEVYLSEPRSNGLLAGASCDLKPSAMFEGAHWRLDSDGTWQPYSTPTRLQENW